MRFFPTSAAASSLASLLLATSNSNSVRVAAFITPPSISNNIKQLSSSSVRTSYASSSSSSSSSTARYSAVAEDVDQQQSSSNNNNNNSGGSNKGSILGEALSGEILSILHSNTKRGGFAVVKVCEEDLIPGAYNNKNTVAANAATPKATAATAGDESSKNEEKEETKVELANALFGKPMPKAIQKSSASSSSSSNGGVIADGDLTGRTVTINNTNQRGMVVAHRHPIAFVLLEGESTPPTATTLATTGEKDGDDNSSSGKCSISPKLVSINPSSIPPGSIVDYLGNSLAVLDDGTVGRSLPKASAATTADAVRSENGVDLENGIGGIGMDGISLMVSNDGSSSNGSSRPIFVPIPKISDIGLIDSPLVSGITAIDALTPIGKGQNMLVIGNADDDDDNGKTSTTNKRGWMINFLRNVIENSRDSNSSGEEGKDTTMMRCYYGLTTGDNTVRSNLLNRLKEAGIQDDVVTVLSTRNYNVKEEEEDGGSGGNESLSTEKAMSAAEAVAVAATACSLGEHHALTTGGDSLVFIDDINLHKSLWDVTTQFLVQVYGVDAVVEADLQGGSSSEMRGYFSGLIQRAARFNVKKGGGSVTLILLSTLPGDEDQDVNTSSGEEEEEPTFEASDFDNMSEKIKTRISMLVKAKVPLTPTNLKKIQIPLPQTSDAENAKRLALQHVDDLISMSDGQIWLDDVLAKSGRSPPLDPSRSITRVGVGADTVSCRADAPALRSVVGSLRFEFQQAMDVMESKSTATTATTGGAAIVGNKKQVQRRDAFLLAMHQESNEMRKLSHECIALLAASRGHLDAVLAKGGLAGTVEGRQAIDGLIDFVEKNASGVVTEIDSTLDMSIEARSVLEDAITSYFAGDK